MKNLCIDTGCIMSLVNKSWLTILLSNINVKHIEGSIKVRGISDHEHSSFDYVTIDLYIQGHCDGQLAIAHIKRDVHLVDNFRARMLIDSDIICLESMGVNMPTRVLTIDSCDMIAPLTCTSFKNRVNRTATTQHATIISTHSIAKMSIKIKSYHLFGGRNFSFQPSSTSIIDLDFEEEVMAHIMNANTSMMHVRNAIAKSIILLRHTKLNHIIDFEEKSCYHADSIDAHLAIDVSWKRKIFNKLIAVVGLIMVAIFDIMTSRSDRSNGFLNTIEAPHIAMEAASKLITLEGIIIYDTTTTHQLLSIVVAITPTIWCEDGTINISKAEWMLINIIFDAKLDSSKVYSIES